MQTIKNKNQGVKTVQYDIILTHFFGTEKLKIKFIIVAKNISARLLSD